MAMSEETREQMRYAEANMRDIKETIPALAEQLRDGKVSFEEFIGTVAADVTTVADAVLEVIAALEYESN